MCVYLHTHLQKHTRPSLIVTLHDIAGRKTMSSLMKFGLTKDLLYMIMLYFTVSALFFAKKIRDIVDILIVTIILT